MTQSIERRFRRQVTRATAAVLLAGGLAVAATAIGAGAVVEGAAASAAQPDRRPPSEWRDLAGVARHAFSIGRPSLGASVRDLDAADAEAGGLGPPTGVVIVDVRADGPAARAGLLAGDRLAEFDGMAVRSVRQLARLVGETPPGRTVTAVADRDGDRVEVQVELRAARGLDLGRMDALRDLDVTLPTLPDIDVDVDVRWGPGRLGVSVQRLGDQLADYFGVDAGVLVTRVQDGSPAAVAGITAGDVITAADGSPVVSLAALRGALARAGGEVALDVVRDRTPLSVTVDLESRPRQTRGRPI